MVRKPIRRVVLVAAQVVVLSLTTAPIVAANAASDRSAQAASREEQVSVRVTNGRLHATVRTEPGRVAGIAYASSADAGEWRVLDETVATATEGGVAQLNIDLDEYADQVVTLALVTAADADFTTDLGATEALEIVLDEGDLYASQVDWEKDTPVALKGRGSEISLKGSTALGSADELALKGIVISLKGVVVDDLSGDL